MSDADARAALTQIKGIGAWTSDIYLLMALGRPDIWPVGDLALATAAGAVKGLDERPTAEDLEALGEAWRPWRAVAARILWHHYLETARKPRRGSSRKACSTKGRIHERSHEIGRPARRTVGGRQGEVARRFSCTAMAPTATI